MNFDRRDVLTDTVMKLIFYLFVFVLITIEKSKDEDGHYESEKGGMIT